MTKVYRIKFFISDNMVHLPTDQLVDGKFVAGGAEQPALGESLIYNLCDTRIIMVPVTNNGQSTVTRIEDGMVESEELTAVIRRKVGSMTSRLLSHATTPITPSTIDGANILALQLSFIDGRIVYAIPGRTASSRKRLAYEAREAYVTGTGHRIEVDDTVVFFTEYNPALSYGQEHRDFESAENLADPFTADVIKVIKAFYGDLDTFKTVVSQSWNTAMDYAPTL